METEYYEDNGYNREGTQLPPQYYNPYSEDSYPIAPVQQQPRVRPNPQLQPTWPGNVKQAPKSPARMPKARVLALASTMKKWLVAGSLLGFISLSGLVAYNRVDTATTSTSSGSSSATSTSTSSSSTATSSSQDNNGFFNQGGNNLGSSNSSNGSNNGTNSSSNGSSNSSQGPVTGSGVS